MGVARTSWSLKLKAKLGEWASDKRVLGLGHTQLKQSCPQPPALRPGRRYQKLLAAGGKCEEEEREGIGWRRMKSKSLVPRALGSDTLELAL